MFSFPMNALLLSLFLSVVSSAGTMTKPAVDAGRVIGDAKDAAIQPQLVHRPSFSSIGREWRRAGGPDVDAVVIIDYVASGKVISARLLASTGHASLDDAIVGWCLKARVEPGMAGSGRLPMTLSKSSLSFPLSDNPGFSRDPKTYPVINLERDVQDPPSLQPIIRAAQRSRIVVDLDLLLVVNERGRVAMVKLSSTTGNPSLDRDILAWGRRLKVRTNQLMMARLPIRMGVE
jgi:outer membrane biosynthesis protein TonB